MPPNPNIIKACKAMNNLGYKPKIVRPVLVKLLELYDNNWMLIEEDNYQVLVDAILDSEEQNVQRVELQHLNSWSENKAEENEPPSKKSKLSSQERQSSTSSYASMPNSSKEIENQHHGKQKLPELTYEIHQDSELKSPCNMKYSHVKGKSRSSPLSLVIVEQAKEANIVSDNGSDKSYSLVPLTNLENSGGSTPLLLEDVCSIGKKSGLVGDSSEAMDYEAEKNENDAQETLKLDIASSSGGEVKLSLTAKSSPKSDIRVPSLEALLKQVEERCLKSYDIPQTNFSMLGLMRDACECFLAAGATRADDVGAEVMSSLDISKDPDSEVKGIDCQHSIDSTISKDPVRILNLHEVSPQIPRFGGSIELNLSRCRIYLNLDLERFGGMKRNIMDVNNNYVPSSSRMVIVKKCYYHYITDITKGQEAYEISLINEINKEQRPAFNYIPNNMTYQNEYLRFLHSRVPEENCCSIGDCLSLEIPCACAGKSGFEFAYTPGCLLKEKFLDNVLSKNHSAIQNNLFYCEDCPVERFNGDVISCKCKGHVVRNFIKECSYKCGCGINCGNRVVQRGITAKLQVFMTAEQKGWGLRTLEDIPKGAFICEYVGEVITHRESFERNMKSTVDKPTYPILLDAGWSTKGVLKDEEALCLDATVHGNVARFINHRCFDANLVEIPVEVETPYHNYYHLALFTTRKVNAIEELTWDYGIDFYHNVKAFQCLCGSKFCRDRKSLKRRLIICN